MSLSFSMIIVIFVAELGTLDNEYHATSAHLRAAAFEEYGCLDFKSVEQEGEEITYSIWPDIEHVHKWSAYAEHVRAKAMARSKWYKSYRSIIATIQRDVQFP